MAVVALLGLLAIGWSHSAPKPASTDRPQLALLTSLPIMFGEGFSLDAPSSPIRQHLEADYRLHPIGVADAGSLKGQKLLFMAHARAQPASALADLDQWVRDGGHLLLLTDPLLSWHSERPLGDPLRPPLSFADTALLAHWGLALSGPDPVGPATRWIGNVKVAAVSPGALASSGACAVESDEFVARCTIGKGEVTVIADADWLDVNEGNQTPGPSSDLGLDALTRELARLR